MARTRSRIAGAATLILIAGMTLGAGSPVLAGKPGGGDPPPGPGATKGPLPIPTHVYAPYFETWTTDSIAVALTSRIVSPPSRHAP